jgi:hypothetical protein
VTRTWEVAFQPGPLSADDLNRIPFTLLVPTGQRLLWSTSAASCTSHARLPRARLSSWVNAGYRSRHGDWMLASCLSTRHWTARRSRAREANCCGLRLGALCWRWSADFLKRFATSSRRTLPAYGGAVHRALRGFHGVSSAQEPGQVEGEFHGGNDSAGTGKNVDDAACANGN